MKKAATPPRKSAAPRRTKASPAPSSRARWRRPHPKYLGALVGGVIFLGLGALLWNAIAGMTFNDSLLKKLPADATVAGVARVTEADTATLERLSKTGKVLPASLAPVLQTVRAADGDGQLVNQALGKEFAWSDSATGSLAVFTVRNEDKLRELSGRLGGSVEGVETARANDADIRTGTLKGTTQKVSYGVIDRTLYVASDPRLIGTAARETAGFVTAPGYPEVSERMPTARGGYIFINTRDAKSAQVKRYRMVGLAWSKDGDNLKLSVRTSDGIPVQTRLPESDGRLLAPVELASASVAGTDAVQFIRLVEQQRQRDELPKVLSFQKAVAGLDRALQDSTLDGFLAKASGDWSYSRYAGTTGEQWMAAFEFPDENVARTTVDDLATRLNQRVTIPVRREVVTILPDGTSSREVESEGRVPVAFTDVPTAGAPAKTAGLPGIGSITYAVEGRYFLIGSEPASIDRLRQLVATAPAKGPASGELTLRTQSDQTQTVITKTDPILDWVLAATPSSGDFILTPAGLLTGGIEFGRRQ